MPIQTAVASSVKTPGVYVSVDLLGAAASPGTNPLTAIIMAPKGSAGTLVNNTEVRRIAGADDAAVAFGANTQGHLAAIRLFKKCPTALVDAVSPAPSAGSSASGTLTCTGTATVAGTIRVDVCGRTLDVPVSVGDTPTQKAANIAFYVAAYAASLNLPVSASSALGVATLTAIVAGPWGNDITFGAKIIAGGTGETVAASGARLAGGTTEPDFTTALASIATSEYRVILQCLSNADALDATTASNVAKLVTHITTHESGLEAALQTGLVGCTTNSLSTPTAATNARNFGPLEFAFGFNHQSLPCELAGDEAGDILLWHSIRANYNRIGNKTLGIYGSKDPVADKLSQTQLESLLTQGVTPFNYEKGSNDIKLVRPISTHFLASGGGVDFRIYDMSDVHGMYTVIDDIRLALPQEFPNCSISADLPAGADPLPPGVVEIKDVKNFVVARLGKWTKLGVVAAAKLQAAVDDGSLIVQIDASDATQVNLFLPLSILAPLAKFSVVGSKQAA